MPLGKCLFSDRWLQYPHYKDWLRKGRDKHSARCVLCMKDFDVSNMGETALRSHSKGHKHSQLVREKEEASGLSIRDLFTQSEKDAPNSDASSTTSKKSSLTDFVTRSDCLKAEIIWALKVIKSHYSFKSCFDSHDVFVEMFPDSEIAKQFSCGERKCSYLCNFGIAPYFRELLKTQARKEKEAYVLLFDESMNSKTKNKQMDLHIRIWGSNGQVSTRYYDSAFMGHATAEDLVEHFSKITEGLDMKKLLQVSMDGPNVNWKFYRLMQDKLSTVDNTSLLNIGSCGLHIVHGAFRDGSVCSTWPVQKLLQSLYRLFNDTPARRDDFMKATGSDIFPLEFCAHRWVENVNVVDRALIVYPSIKVFVEKVKNKVVPSPNTVSFENVVSCTHDKLIVVKLHTFSSIAKQLSTFLINYQTDKPMVPFLADDLFRLLSALMRRFVKTDSLTNASTISKLMQLDPKDKKIHKTYNKIDLGFAAEAELKKIQATTNSTSKVSEREVMELRTQCKDFLVKTTAKIIEKCPLKYSLTRYLTCLDPRKLSTSKQQCLDKMKLLLNKMVEANKVMGGISECDDILFQFEDFINTTVVEHHSQFESFKPYDSRLDLLFHQTIGTKECFKKLWAIVRDILLISHGQASVERGFSVNRQIEVENLLEESLVSQRIICDHIESVGGITKVDISKQLLLSAGAARQKYMTHLENQRREKEKDEDQLSLEKLRAFIPQLLSRLFIESLVYGNTTKQHSVDMLAMVEGILKEKVNTKPLAPSQFKRFRELQLPDGCYFVYKKTNTVHSSSCIETYYQCGVQETNSNVLLELFCQIIAEPCFTVLRTQEQLGYIVFSGLRRHCGVQGLRVIVQSDREPAYVESRVEAFLYSMESHLNDMTEDSFNKHLKALSSKRQELPKKLSEQNGRFWSEIVSQQYNFDRDNIEVAHLKMLKKEDLFKFYMDNLSHDAPSRHKLSIHVLSTAPQSQEEVTPAAPTSTDGLLPVPSLCEPVGITDEVAFKRGLGLYPLAKPYIDIKAKSKL